MRKKTYQNTQPPYHAASQKRDTALAVPNDSEEQDREQKENAVAEEALLSSTAAAVKGSVPVSER